MKRIAVMFLFALVELGACLGGCTGSRSAPTVDAPPHMFCASKFGQPCPDAGSCVRRSLSGPCVPQDAP